MKKTVLLAALIATTMALPAISQGISQSLWRDICEHHENAVRAIEILDSRKIAVFGDNTGPITFTLKDHPAIVEAISRYQMEETDKWAKALHEYNKQQDGQPKPRVAR